MAQTFAVLSDGTTSASFADGAGGATWYKIESSWTPRVANLRRSQLGGRGPYEDVREDLPISVGGSNAAHMYANISTLKQLLDQADRWRRNENVTAVTFRYSPTHATISSAASPLQAAVWDTELQLPDTFDVINAGSAATVWMQGARLGFTRRGLWAHTSASGSAAVANGAVGTFSVGSSVATQSPTKISTTSEYVGQTPSPYQYRPFFWAVAENTADIVFDTRSGAFPSGEAQWTYRDETSKLAINLTRVLRYTPTDTNERYCVPDFSALSAGMYSVLMSFRNNSSTTSFVVKIATYEVGASTVSSGFINQCSFVAQPFSGSAFPLWRAVGRLNVPNTFTRVFLSSIASSAAGTLDVDGICFVRLDRGGQVFEFSNAVTLSSVVSITATLDQNITSGISPTLSFSDKTSSIRSDSFISTKAASVYGVHLATGGSLGVDWWRQVDGASSAQSNTWTVTRTNSYWSPV